MKIIRLESMELMIYKRIINVYYLDNNNYFKNKII